MLAKYPKPPACANCALEHKGVGFAPADGPASAALLFWGEALGYNEALSGTPFIGAAGGMFGRYLKRSQLERTHVRVDNCVKCRPPEDWLDGAPWEHGALTHCRAAYGNDSINQWLGAPAHGFKVLVTLGGVALRQILGLEGLKGVSVRDFHGTVHRDPTDRFWVVPTFHPSFLQRGATNLLDVVRFDLGVAQRLTRDGHRPRAVSLLLDPAVALVEKWVETYLAAVARDPEGVWLAVDVETPDKAGGRDEGELTNEDRSYTLTRINLSSNVDEGLTVPAEGPYLTLVRRALAGATRMLLWHYDYDCPRLIHNQLLDPETFYAQPGKPQALTQIWDLMWAAHKLQSDLPRGLGFWAPFYSDYGAWKHLARIPGREAEYAAVDGFQTLRIGYGLVRDLAEAGMWDTFERHVRQLDLYALKPAEQVGLLIDTDRLAKFKDKLEVAANEKLALMKDAAGAGALKPKGGYRTMPDPEHIPASITGATKKKGKSVKADYLEGNITLVQKDVAVPVNKCTRCGKTEKVGPKHNCYSKAEREQEPGIRPEIVQVTQWESRWFYQLPFNPDAPKQVLEYILDQGHTPGKAKKTKKDTTDAATLKRLAKTTGDPLYQHILDYRAIGKVLGTYVVGVERRLDTEGRVHSTFTHKPSTQRLSSVNPNVQNVITDNRSGKDSLAAGFRHCVVAAKQYEQLQPWARKWIEDAPASLTYQLPAEHVRQHYAAEASCRLLEVDYAGIEAVETGWFIEDPQFIRLAKLGVHAYLTSHLIGKPAELAWSDEDLAMYFGELKKREKVMYDRAKRTVHGNNYGLTIHGMHNNFPEVFPDLKTAKHTQDLYYSLCPKLPAFHRHVREKAHRQGYLGGPGDHPYGYRHWFWSVLNYKPTTEARAWGLEKQGRPIVKINGRPFEVVLGEDSKRVIAFYPQSTSAGVLKDAMLLLFHPESSLFIGDRYFGRTPLRAPVHDSLLLEVPHRQWDLVLERVLLAMRRPLGNQPCPVEWGVGEYLSIGVDAKAGDDWLDMESLALPELELAPAAAAETMYLPPEDDEQEDDYDLGTSLTATVN